MDCVVRVAMAALSPEGRALYSGAEDRLPGPGEEQERGHG